MKKTADGAFHRLSDSQKCRKDEMSKSWIYVVSVPPTLIVGSSPMRCFILILRHVRYLSGCGLISCALLDTIRGWTASVALAIVLHSHCNCGESPQSSLASNNVTLIFAACSAASKLGATRKRHGRATHPGSYTYVRAVLRSRPQASGRWIAASDSTMIICREVWGTILCVPQLCSASDSDGGMRYDSDAIPGLTVRLRGCTCIIADS